MKGEMPVNKKTADMIVQVCFDVVEFSRLYDLDHPESAKKLFQCNEDVKKGLKWFIGSESQKEMQDNINAYLRSIDTALGLYGNLDIPIVNKEGLIVQLTNLQTHLTALLKLVQHNS